MPLAIGSPAQSADMYHIRRPLSSLFLQILPPPGAVRRARERARERKPLFLKTLRHHTANAVLDGRLGRPD